MIAAQTIALIFQSLMGKNYELMPFYTFQQKHYNNLETPYGGKYDIDYQTFAEHGAKTLGTVQTPSDTLANTPYDFSSGTFDGFFWVPIDKDDAPIYDSEGNVINPPDYSFFEDLDILRQTLTKSGWLDLEPYGLGDYKAIFTCSQPNIVSGAIEESGQFQRITVRISGQYNILEKSVETGGDITIALKIDGEWHEFDGVTDLQIGAGTDSGSVQYEDKEATESEVEAISQQFLFTVDAYNPGGGNKALTLIKKKIYQLEPILTPTATLEKSKRMVYVKVVDGTTSIEFWAILSAELATTGQTGVSRYKVSLVNSATRDTAEGT